MYNAFKELKIGNNRNTVKVQEETGRSLVTDKDKSNEIKNGSKRCFTMTIDHRMK